jgi:hypothetical protein
MYYKNFYLKLPPWGRTHGLNDTAEAMCRCQPCMNRAVQRASGEPGLVGTQ